jgi:hypothetical protein
MTIEINLGTEFQGSYNSYDSWNERLRQRLNPSPPHFARITKKSWDELNFVNSSQYRSIE